MFSDQSRAAAASFNPVPRRSSIFSLDRVGLSFTTLIGTSTDARLARGSLDSQSAASAYSINSQSQLSERSLAADTIQRSGSLGGKHILRGTSVNKVMRCFGRQFASSSGSRESWMLSKQVDTIDVFISHNWSLRRSLKFLMCCMHFNFWPIIVTFFAGILCVMSFVAAGLLPHVDAHSQYCTHASVILIFVPLLFSHELALVFGIGGPAVFLDKTCINQENPELKAKGISALGAFLKHSRGMVVLYSDVYLYKLWTVYELAALSLLNPYAKLHVISPIFPIFIIISTLVATLISSIDINYELVGGGNPALEIVAAVLALITFPGFSYLWARRRSRVYEDIARFDVRRVQCHDESDRSYVQLQIHSLMLATGMIQEETGHEEAMEAFNELVKVEVPEALSCNWGRVGISYGYLLMLNFPLIANRADVFALKIGRGYYDSELSLLIDFIYNVGVCFAPVVWTGLSFVFGKAAEFAQAGLYVRAWLCRLSILGCFFLVDRFERDLRSGTRRTDGITLVGAVLSCTLRIALTVIMNRPRHRQDHGYRERMECLKTTMMLASSMSESEASYPEEDTEIV